MLLTYAPIMDEVASDIPNRPSSGSEVVRTKRRKALVLRSPRRRHAAASRVFAAIRVSGVNLVLAAMWLWFAKAHLVFWASTGNLRGFGAMAMEALVAVLFLTRRSSLGTSREPLAWAATVVGAFGPMLMRPVSSGGGGTGAVLLQLAGAAFVCVSLAFLGRSFGLVAANRGVVEQGPYRLVRHPVYLGYLVVQLAYVAENPSIRNAVIVLCATMGQLIRIKYEEDVLVSDPAYEAYKHRVRFRLIPYAY
jgi:protein-S-isoprenylcysteine O-methyltransferase Ste14